MASEKADGGDRMSSYCNLFRIQWIWILVSIFTIFSATTFADQMKQSEIAPGKMGTGEPIKNPLERPAREKVAVAGIAVLPVQSGGRIKPVDTLARAIIHLLHGKEKVKGRHPVEIFFSMLFHPKFWESHPIVPVRYTPLKKDLGLELDRKYFSLKELRLNQKILPLTQELQNKEAGNEKLDPYYQAVSQIRNQVSVFSFLVSGKILALVPPESGADSDKWVGLDQTSEEQKLRFWLIAAAFQNTDPEQQLRTKEKVSEFMQMASLVNTEVYPSTTVMAREVHYNEARPFRWAWVVALLSLILLSASLVRDSSTVASMKEGLPNSTTYFLGLGLFLISFGLQIYGYYLRCMIAERPPVTNMYESVIWVAFGSMFFGFIIELLNKRRVVSICSLIFAILCLMISDLSSAVLDNSIHPLEPVLRSNFWLLIHVLTITLSYAAFALSLMLGNLAIAPLVFLGRTSKLFPLKPMAQYAYRSVQIGVVLLGTGTILGGIWADYSWGRFWGWDPKETWALIAFLGYIAIIHARYRGMVKDFGFLASCIIAFLLVLMAWYGVNFILGAGLHSYGFSSGGNTEVFVYSVLQCVFVALAAFKVSSALIR